MIASRVLLLLLSACLLTASPGVGQARLHFVTLHELIAGSELAVEGVLVHVVRETAGSWVSGRAGIAVQQVIFGSAVPGDTLAFRWEYPEDIELRKGNVLPDPGSEEGREALWLLDIDQDGIAKPSGQLFDPYHWRTSELEELALLLPGEPAHQYRELTSDDLARVAAVESYVARRLRSLPGAAPQRQPN